MKKSLRQSLGWAMILSLTLLSIPVIPNVGAASLISVRDVISNSAPLATGVTHNFYFTTNATLTAGYLIDVTFAAGFTNIIVGNVTCPTNTTASVSGQVVTCTVNAAQTLTPGVYTVTVTSVTNPAKVNPEGIADTYQMLIETQDNSTNVLERANAMVAIIEAVTVTATVDAILEFSISGVSNGEVAKNETTNVTSTTSSIPFGTLPIGSSLVAAQDLKVTTNAGDGYSVVVFQDQDLISAAGDRIRCFEEGSCVTYSSTTAWSIPSGTIDSSETYGHFGFTSEDQGIAVTCQDPALGTGYFGLKAADLWAGFNGTDQAVVMCHTGPADGLTEHKGATRVAYQIEITAMQAAGDYTNTLTYIATPIY